MSEINILNGKLKEESNLLNEKENDFEKTKMISEEEKIKLERNQVSHQWVIITHLIWLIQQNENKMSHDLLAERDRTHELQIDLTALEMQIKHSLQDRKSIQGMNHYLLVISYES